MFSLDRFIEEYKQHSDNPAKQQEMLMEATKGQATENINQAELAQQLKESVETQMAYQESNTTENKINQTYSAEGGISVKTAAQQEAEQQAKQQADQVAEEKATQAAQDNEPTAEPALQPEIDLETGAAADPNLEYDATKGSNPDATLTGSDDDANRLANDPDAIENNPEAVELHEEMEEQKEHSLEAKKDRFEEDVIEYGQDAAFVEGVENAGNIANDAVDGAPSPTPGRDNSGSDDVEEPPAVMKEGDKLDFEQNPDLLKTAGEMAAGRTPSAEGGYSIDGDAPETSPFPDPSAGPTPKPKGT